MNPALDILRNESTALIHMEVRAGVQRDRLDLAIREAIVKGGLSIDAVSEATGVAPKDIRRVLETPAPIEDLNALLGVA